MLLSPDSLDLPGGVRDDKGYGNIHTTLLECIISITRILAVHCVLIIIRKRLCGICLIMYGISVLGQVFCGRIVCCFRKCQFCMGWCPYLSTPPGSIHLKGVALVWPRLFFFSPKAQLHEKQPSVITGCAYTQQSGAAEGEPDVIREKQDNEEEDKLSQRCHLAGPSGIHFLNDSQDRIVTA